jgi:alpha-L-rhamnosidase
LLTWYYENLAGIRTDKTEVGFKKIIMKPSLPDELQFVNATYKSAYGLIKSSWKKNNKTFEWNMTIPANSSATIYIPAATVNDVLESGKNISGAEGVQLVKWEKGVAVITVASGDYQFKSVMQ